MNCTQEFVLRNFIFAVPEGQIKVIYFIWCTFCVAARICMNVKIQKMAVGWLQVAKQCQDKFSRELISQSGIHDSFMSIAKICTPRNTCIVCLGRCATYYSCTPV